MRKKAIRSSIIFYLFCFKNFLVYTEVVEPGVNDILDRSGTLFREAKLNLSRSYQADQSIISTLSSSENLFANDPNGSTDFFYVNFTFCKIF